MKILPEKFKALFAFSGHKGSWLWLPKFGGLITIFLVFFIPAYRDSGLVTSNVESLRKEISDLKKISTSLLTPEELQETEQHVKDFESRLTETSKAGKLLDFISDAADKHHLNVVQIYSDSPVTAKSEAGKDLEFKGKKLMLLPINFRVETDYKTLGNFLKSIKDNLQANVVVESLILKKTSPQSETLQCDNTLSCAVI